MEKETNQENPSLLSNNNTSITKEDSSSNKHPGNTAVAGGGGAGGGGDRLKRDEWSEGAVSSLLEAYENKWVLRNRAKLKGHDWEEVARYVSARANCTKSPKTQTQCKNKIESMKKRYRSESAIADGSSWPLYPRLDLLLRGCTAPPPPQPQLQPSAVPQAATPISTNSPLMTLQEPPMTVVLQQQHQLPAPALPAPHVVPQLPGNTQNSLGSNGFDRTPKEDGAGTKLSGHLSDKQAMETDSSTPALYSDKERPRSKMKMETMAMTKKKKKKKKKKRRKQEEWEVGESVQWLAQVVLKSEQARMETMKDIEKMRAEAEAKRGEMELKRTEIIASTQLEIARLFAGSNKGVDSSLRIGRN